NARPDSSVRFLAAHRWNAVACTGPVGATGARRPVAFRLERRTGGDLSHQSLRSVRPAPGICRAEKSRTTGIDIQDRVLLSAGATPDLPRLPDCVLGHAGNDDCAFRLRSGNHGLHAYRYPV